MSRCVIFSLTIWIGGSEDEDEKTSTHSHTSSLRSLLRRHEGPGYEGDFNLAKYEACAVPAMPIFLKGSYDKSGTEPLNFSIFYFEYVVYQST